MRRLTQSMPAGKIPADIAASNSNNYYYYQLVINHCTYLLGTQTEIGNKACAKRLAEKMFAKIQFTMVRITNLNSIPGFEIPNMLSGFNYVVLKSPKRLKQVVTKSELIEEKPKVNKRHRLMEFGIFQRLKRCGKRRNRSTTIISRKGSSLTQLTNSGLSGSYEGQQLLKLQNNLSNGLKANNLSAILSDPNFLISCWGHVRSDKGILKSTFDGSINGIKKSWFLETAGKMRNGAYQFQVARSSHIFKPDSDKQRLLTMQSSKDKIVQEGIRFLLEIIFESLSKDSSYGWRSNKGCLMALNDIRKKCKRCSWYLEGKIVQQSPTMNSDILMSIIKEKVDDQAFIDLLYKYIKLEHGENFKSVPHMKIGVIQREILSPILANIFISPFDEWTENHLMPIFNTIDIHKKNSEFVKKYNNQDSLKNKNIRLALSMYPNNYKRMYYFRYADNFIIGVEGSKKDCFKLKTKINSFLQDKFNGVLGLEKTKITNATKDYAKFLGYKIYKAKTNEMPFKKNKLGRLTQITPRLILNAPINEIVKNLIERRYATNSGNPVRNARFINHHLSDIIKHYRAVEQKIMNYYSLCNNYRKLANRVHYILKYSCVLTIASKMKLKTKKKVFKKYGKDLKILNRKGKIIAYYPTIRYKREKNIDFKSFKSFDEENFIGKIDIRI